MTSQDEQRANSRNNPGIDQPDDPARKTFIHLGDDTLAQAQRENGAAMGTKGHRRFNGRRSRPG